MKDEVKKIKGENNMREELVISNCGLFIDVEVYATVEEIAENKFKV